MNDFLAKTLYFAVPLNKRGAFHRVTLAMEHPGANIKSPDGAPCKRLSRPIFAPLLTVVLSWKHKEELSESTDLSALTKRSANGHDGTPHTIIFSYAIFVDTVK